MVISEKKRQEINIKFLLKKLITFLEVQMMIKEGHKLIQYKFICNKRLNVAI